MADKCWYRYGKRDKRNKLTGEETRCTNNIISHHYCTEHQYMVEKMFRLCPICDAEICHPAEKLPNYCKNCGYGFRKVEM